MVFTTKGGRAPPPPRFSDDDPEPPPSPTPFFAGSLLTAAHTATAELQHYVPQCLALQSECVVLRAEAEVTAPPPHSPYLTPLLAREVAEVEVECDVM